MVMGAPFAWEVDLQPPPVPVEGNGHAEPAELADVVELEEHPSTSAGVLRLVAFLLVASFTLAAGLWIWVEAVVLYVRGLFV